MQILSPRQKRPIVQGLFTADAETQSLVQTSPIPIVPEFSDLHELQKWFAFASQFFADFRTTASVIPSSPQLAREMVLPVHEQNARVVVEFGPGTGPMTYQILDALPSDGALRCFEVNPVFVRYLQNHILDTRLQVFEAPAQDAPEVLREEGLDEADAVVSSLPLSFFPHALRHQILQAAKGCLRRGGVFTQFQYASGLDCSGRFPKPYDLRPLLRRHFPRVERRLVWLNVPPSWVYRCYAD
jgi:phospholipid N-methyltransferase